MARKRGTDQPTHSKRDFYYRVAFVFVLRPSLSASRPILSPFLPNFFVSFSQTNWVDTRTFPRAQEEALFSGGGVQSE